MKRNFVSYDRTRDIVEIIVRDGSGGKIGHFKFNANDDKSMKNVFKLLNDKHGINFRPEISYKEHKSIFDY